MEFLKQTYLGNTLETWATAFVIVILGMLVLLLAKRILVRRVGAFAERTVTALDDLLVDLIARTKFFTILAVSLYAGSEALTKSPGAETTAQKLLVLVLLGQSVIWGNRVITFWLENALRRGAKDDGSSAGTVTAIGFTGKLVLWSIALLLALDNLGFNITTLVAGLGIGGIAVALAVQNILGDVFASLSIVLDKPFVIGDFIIVDEHLGTVEHIGIKTTRIRSLSGEQIAFSNGELLKSRIRNFKRMAERRVLFTFGVTYDTPLDKMKAIGPWVRTLVEAQSPVRFDRVHFKEYGDSSLVFEVVYFVLSPDYNLYMDIQQAINFGILQKFTDEGVEFAFPTVTVMTGGAKENVTTVSARSDLPRR